MAIEESFAKAHIDKWINAWNAHDLKAIISLYAENIEFRSPKVKIVFPDKTNATIYNRKDLEAYFSLGLKRFSELHFTPIDFIVKGNNILLEYHGLPDNKIKLSVIEKL